MKKISTLVLMVLFLLSASTKLSAQISGTVFRDYNFDGVKQPTGFPLEPGTFGVEVRAYNSAGAQVGAVKTTNIAGTYNFTAVEIPSGTAVRIEFTAPSGTFDSKNGTANGSSVQFVTAPAAAVGYAIASQEWYSQTANPFLATNGFTNGDANTSGVGSPGVNNNLYIFPYDMANDGGATRRRPNSELGAIYGLSYQRVTRTLLMSAYVKRHTGFGPDGISAIYKSSVDGTGVPGAATLLVKLNTIGIDVGTDPHTGLPALSNARNADPATFAAIGKRGIGGIDLSEDGKTLYVVNMFQNKLHKINVGAPLKTSFTAADVTGTYNINGPAGSLSWHPMACKVANGKVYVGGVYVAEKTTTHNLTTDTVGSRGIVYEFDPATSVFTQVLSYPFNYRRGFSNADYRFPFKCNWWCAWQNNGAGGAADPLQADYNTANGTFTGGIYYPQPMLSDIEFDVDGSMIIGIRDRFGDQIGYQNVSTDNLPATGGFPTSAGNYFRGLTSGEVLRAGKNLTGVSYTMENKGQYSNNGSALIGTLNQVGPDNPANTGSWNPTVPAPWGGQYGPGWGGTGAGNAGGPNQGTEGGFFYYNHNFGVTGTGTNGLGAATTLNGTATTAINAHYSKSLGTLALLAGSNEVVHNLMDPVNTAFANGCSRMINSGANAGNMAQRLQLVATVINDPTNGGKSNGMGDIELLTDYQPIEIGNRIWKDANANGKQEPGTAEDGINGITVQLVSPGPNNLFGDGDDVIVDTKTTVTLNGQAGSYYFSTLATADARKPVSFNGVGANDILPGFDYQVRILNATGASQQAGLVGTRPTTTDVAGNTADNIDNDGIASGTQVAAVFNSTITSHNLDFGFKPQAALGNKVFRDDNKDGTQDATEPGVAGVTVMLYRNGLDQLPGTADDVVVGATTTDAFGNYFFDNLTPTDQTNAATIGATSYNIRVTPPANYSFSPQTNTTDDNLTTGPSITGSDVNPLGTSYSINLSSGENNLNIDAGLITRLPVATNSIGDRVWLDNGAGGGTAGNGTADGTEPGVSGVTVTLYDDATGNIVAITTTDANGNYLFNNLPANTNYKVGFSAPGGTIFSPGGTLTIGNATVNSDPNATTGITTTINTGVAGTQITGVDAGLTNDPNGALGDFVWNDINKNGIQDAGEPGIPGVTMQLYDPGANNVPGGGDDVLKATTTTDAFGYYIFPNLIPGKYFVVATQPAGYVVSPKDVTAGNLAGDVKDNDFGNGAAPYAGKLVSNVYTLPATAGGLTRDMTVDLGISNSTLNLNSIGDKVWNDINKNGLDDGAETGVQNVTVRLLTGLGAVVNNPSTGKPYITVTDANGNYKFVDLPDGNYIVEFANLPAGYVFTTQDASGTGNPGSASDGANDSDVKKSTGRTLVIDLDAGSLLGSQNFTKVDAGVTQGIPAGTASLGNRVWYDINGNGVQDAGELGVAGVKVELLDATGAAIDSDPNTAGVQAYIVYTNALGEYSFTGLSAGDYTVKFSNLPAGFTSSAANVGANDAIDADANFVGTSVTATTTATTPIYSLQTGEDNLTVALGIIPAGGLNSLGNFVWNDLNGDGLQTVGEPGVAGVSVNLYTNGVDGLPGTADDVLTAITVTDSLGRYGFVGLANGNYNVEFANFPAGFKLTPSDAAGFTAANGSDANEATGRTTTIALTGGINNQDVDAGLQNTRAALGNYVWEDTNGDGIQDATETGISGVTVTLYAADGTTVLASAITDAAGKYFFSNVNPGTYVVGFSTVPSNLSFTIQNTPGDNGNNTNSDADPVTGKTAIITLVAGETDLTIDAGLKPDNFASVGDFVWNDLDKDGVQDLNEPGVPGILVTLFNSSNVAIGTAITDGNGKYLISKIPAGNNYTIGFSNLPATAIFTTQTSNVSTGDLTLGSDANTSTGKTAAFNLAAGQYLPTVDAGIQKVQVLPIKITSFTAIPKDSKVNLEWFVSLQINVDKYEIEHSTNGFDFRSIQTVQANNNSSFAYTGVHANPVTGLNYYRIKTTEKDGSISYSQIRKVTFGKAVNIDIYPNPTADFINISFSQNMINKSCMVSFIAVDGKILMLQQINNLSQTESFNLNKFAAGTYILRIETSNEVVNRKIRVVK